MIKTIKAVHVTALSLRLFALISPVLLLLACNSSGGTSTSADGAGAASPVALASTALPYGMLNTSYGANLEATDGTQPYTFSLSSGTLPKGLTLSSTGRISGTPTAPASATFVAQVTDSSSPQGSATHSYTLTIVGPLALASANLDAGQIGTPYTSSPLPVAGGAPPYTATLSSGALPAGLTLGVTGILTGTPTTAGTFTFSIAVRDSEPTPQTASATFTLVIKSVPLSFSYPATTRGALGTALTLAPITFTGGTKPVTLAVTSGTLPAGLTLGSDGTIKGAPTASGVFPLIVTATDSTIPAQVVTASLALNIYNTTTSVTVDTTKALATVPATGIGIHTSVYDSSLSDTTALPALLATTGIRMLRYPGGSYSDNYHWSQYTLTPIFSSATPACGITSNGYLAPHTDFGYFLKTLAATGTQAIITVNYGSSLADSKGTKSTGTQGGGVTAPNTCSEPNRGGQPQEAAAWVAYANGDPASTQSIGIDDVGFDWKTVGFWASLRAATPLVADDGYNFLRLGLTAPVGIQYWEIGNEVYYNGYNSNNNSESDVHAPYAYTAGYGSTYASRANVAELSPTAYGTNAVRYIQAMRAVDPTIKLGIVVSSAIDPIPSTWTPAVLTAVCAATTFDFAILHYYPGTYNATTAAQLLSSPQSDMPRLISGVQSNVAAACPASASSVQVFVTETNPDGTLATGTPAAIPGLYATHEILTALESGVANIDWLELHSGAGTFLAEGTETPGPAFYGIEMAHLLADAGDTLVSTSSTNSTLLVHAALQASGKKAILLLNSDPANTASVQVTVTGSTPGATATQYSFGIATSQSGSTLPATSFTIPGSTFSVVVPPYTATELVIP